MSQLIGCLKLKKVKFKYTGDVENLVLWKMNPLHVGVVLSDITGSISKKHEVYWLQEKIKLVNFEQDLIFLKKD